MYLASNLLIDERVNEMRCAVCVCVLSDVDKCRRSSELMVTYNPSFSSNAGPSSPSSPAAAAAAAGGLAVSTEDSVTSPASSTCTSNSSFSPQSPSKPLPLPRTSSRDGYQQLPAPSQPLHRPHSVTGLCLYWGLSLTGTVQWGGEGPHTSWKLFSNGMALQRSIVRHEGLL